MTNPVVSLSPCPRLEFFDSNGNPAVGYKLFTYTTGTSNKKATYTDATGASANTNPIILDARGECSCWLTTDANYKFLLCLPTESDPPVSNVWSVDNFGFANPTFQSLTVTGVLTASGGINVGQWLQFALGDETTVITTGTKLTTRFPAGTIQAVRASLTTASTSGLPAFDIKAGGTSIFSTVITIDANEKTSTTAATPPVLSTTTIADDTEMTFIVNTAGTNAAGAKISVKYLYS